MTNRYINLNGNVIDGSQPVLPHGNRAFRYGDAFFETMRLMEGEILFFEKHLARLRRSMEVLSMDWNKGFSFQNLYLLIRHLEQVNNLKGNGRIRMEVFRNEGGYYLPQSNQVSFLIEAEEGPAMGEYQLNLNGLRVDLFSELAKPVSKLSGLKSCNSLIYVLAAINLKKTSMDDSIMVNTDGNICEGISSNVFMVRKSEVFTPSLDQGCVAGVMREQLIELMREKNKKIIETRLTLQDLLAADEVFLSNVTEGVRWVGAIRTKRYFNTFSRWLVKELNELLQTKKA